MRIASWNVNGIRAVATKGFTESLDKIGADIIGIQEIKALKEQLGPEITDIPGYKSWFYSAEKRLFGHSALFEDRAQERRVRLRRRRVRPRGTRDQSRFR